MNFRDDHPNRKESTNPNSIPIYNYAFFTLLITKTTCDTSIYLAFHLTLPTHFAQSLTSSLSQILSTVNHSLANSSLLAMRCTKL